MKLSDAIMLGSTFVRFEPATWGQQWKDDKCGCLVGTGVFAVHTFQGNGPIHGGMLGIQTWPWLGAEFSVPDVVKTYRINGKQDKAIGWEIISGWAFAISDGKVTLEQAVEWIRQNEPKEEEVNGGKSEGSDCTGHEPSPIVRCGDPESVGVTTRD